MDYVKLKYMIEKMDLKFLNEKDGVFDGWEIRVAALNRPAFQLAGYFEEYAYERVQLIGLAEYRYLHKMEREERCRIYEKLMEYDTPCFIFCRGFEPDEDFLFYAKMGNTPVLQTDKETSFFSSQLTIWLNQETAPRIKMHGVLVDVYGEGVLITGESGLGKSEAALELLRRGHRLVADDVVQVRKIDEETLVGTAPDLTKHFIELRGIGIVDVRTMFGVECVKETQNISFVIRLEEWNREKNYDRTGLEEEHVYILGNRLVQNTIPVRPGRNLAVIVETAAVNFRQKQMGYNAYDELHKRLMKQYENK